jgi:hypothetical protein
MVSKKLLILFSQFVCRQHQCLSALVRFCGVVGSNFGEPKVVRSHGLKLLSTLLEVDTANPSILEFDAFGILVSLTFSLPSLFNGDQAAPLPSGNIQDANILRLVYVAHIVQILLTTDQVRIPSVKPIKSLSRLSVLKFTLSIIKTH